MRRTLAVALIGLALLAALVASFAFPITRTPAFHVYADDQPWLGITNGANVLSNLPFMIVAQLFVRRARTAAAQLAAAGVGLIAIGSAAYHFAPSDTTLALDWGPIIVTLAFVNAAVIADRLGERAGRIAFVLGPVLAIASVIVWLATGGTENGGNMMPYVALQAIGVSLPAVLALVLPGSIPRVPLMLALALFALARLVGAYDRELLAAIGASGHSLKHVAAAAAA